jgi:hypothetical protein
MSTSSARFCNKTIEFMKSNYLNESFAKLPLARIKPKSKREQMRIGLRTLFYFAKGSNTIKFPRYHSSEVAS